MLCPYRVKTVYEYGVVNERLVVSEQHAEFEECNKFDCPLYAPMGYCTRADKEISDAEN